MIKLVTLREEHFREIGWEDYATAEECVEYFKDHKRIQVDSETNGLGFMFSKMWCIQIGDKKTQFVIDTETVPIMWFQPLLTEKILIFHNALFDLVFLYSADIVPPMENIRCTFLREKVLHMGKSYDEDIGAGLADVGRRYLGIDLEKTSQLTIIDHGLDRLEHIQYSGLDVEHLEDIMDLQQEKLEEWDLMETVWLEEMFVNVLAYMEYCGIYRDPVAGYKLIRDVEYEEWGAHKKLFKYLEENMPDIYERYSDINWGSSKQVIELFKEIGIDVMNEKTKKETTDIKYLKKFKKDFPILELFIDYKQKNKLVTTYGRSWEDYACSDKRVHTKFKQIVDTGRTSSGDTRKNKERPNDHKPFPNVQNVPAKERFRDQFVGQGPNLLITVDYSGQESVLLADISEDEDLLEFYRNGGADLHSFAAQKMYPDKLDGLTLKEIKENHPEIRQAAKSVNFSIAYGGTGYTIADDMNIPKHEGEAIYYAYLDAFPGLSAYFEKQRKEGLQNGYILVPDRFKRKRFVGNYEELKSQMANPKLNRVEKKQLKRTLGAIERNSLNTPCQSAAANMSKLAGVYFLQEIIKRKWWKKVKIVNFPHDEIVAEAHQKTAEKVAPVLCDAMTRAGNSLLKNLTINVSCTTAKAWSK